MGSRIRTPRLGPAQLPGSIFLSAFVLSFIELLEGLLLLFLGKCAGILWRLGVPIIPNNSDHGVLDDLDDFDFIEPVGAPRAWNLWSCREKQLACPQGGSISLCCRTCASASQPPVVSRSKKGFAWCLQTCFAVRRWPSS